MTHQAVCHYAVKTSDIARTSIIVKYSLVDISMLICFEAVGCQCLVSRKGIWPVKVCCGYTSSGFWERGITLSNREIVQS